MLQEKGVPVQALKFIPGFGDQVQKLLFGDPYAAHTYFADMLYHVQQLLDQDSDFDPVEVTRRAEFADAEQRAKERNRAILDKWAEDDRASTDTPASWTFDGFGTNGVGKVYPAGSPDEAVPFTIPDVEGTYHRQQAKIQSPVVDGRSTSEQTL